MSLIDIITVNYTIGEDDAASGRHHSRILDVKSHEVTRKHLAAEPVLARSLPAGAVDETLSQLCAWIGYAHLVDGYRAEARAYLWRRLRSAPWDLQSLKHLAGSFLPTPLLRRRLRSG